jgi:hypothetical protein
VLSTAARAGLEDRGATAAILQPHSVQKRAAATKDAPHCGQKRNTFFDRARRVGALGRLPPTVNSSNQPIEKAL